MTHTEKLTAGNWLLKEEKPYKGIGKRFLIQNEKGINIAEVKTDIGYQYDEEVEANAIIIQNSKELFEILGGLISDVQNLISENDIEWQQAGHFEEAKLLINKIKNNG